jgi:ATP-dependent helicase/nuclease subunit A
MSVVDLFSRGEARHAQEEAADPTVSVFVTANAGSGKTKTLIDRVARLLLAKAKPETILCVTYTKAAASEMQRRLYERLGGWSVASDAELRKALGQLRSRAPASFDHQDLSEARGLFAAALETPGGLKIQTIHAFCEKVLKRFPLEAGVPPGFRVMDEPAAAAVAAAARKAVAHHVLNVPGELADAYGRLAVSLDFRRFQAMFAEFENRRGALGEFFERQGGLAGAIAWAWRAVDIAPGTDPETLAADAMARIERGLYRRAAEALKPGGKQDAERARVLAALAEAERPSLEDAVGLFFTKDDEPRKWVETAKLLRAEPELQTFLLSEQSRLEAVQERLRAAKVGRDSEDALSLAHAYLTAYRIEKDASGALDFADLVEKTCALLRDRPAAAWVLYKLDGGVDHILLDEAQDTAPEQWAIVDALTEDFFAGAGRRAPQKLDRGVFVVGDRKQSIYSFQGARPELLAERFEAYSARVADTDYRVRRIDLLESWRSTPQVLGFVDAVFTPAHLNAAVQPGDPVVHEIAPPRQAHAGCVDVWDMEVDRKGADRGAWALPLDIEPEDSANKKLARRIAGEIDRLIKSGEAVHDKETLQPRPAHAGDVLILVRRRGALFEEILRALKQAGLPVAGADRLSLSNHIIFDDLLALARFALFPGDDLTLAALLKSPFCGLDDDSLYALAHGRQGRLWRALRDRADEQPLWAEAARFLRLALDTARTQRPFEFFVRLVEHAGPDGRSMRQRLLTRLGPEARDALDEFLNQALAAEDRGAHDLESLADELSGLEIVVKREMEAAKAEVRVMTAHGAKGLEAPIVFLPETNLQNTSRGSPLLRVDRGAEGVGFLWCPRSAGDCPATADARKLRRDREDAEAYRLLYVALTRARDRLVLCGRRAERTDPEKLSGWWGAIRDALSAAGVVDEVRELEHADGARFRRYGPDPQRVRGKAAAEAPAPDLPAWARTPAKAEAYARYTSPSDLGEGAVAAAASPLAESAGLGRFRRGDLIHRLLQLLPDLAPAAWAQGAADLLARERDLTPAQRAEMAAAALSVLEDPRFAEVFGPGSRPEVAIAGTAAVLPPALRISGRIDRLVVLPDRVLVVDFKTNRPSPDAIEAADPAYLRQMALYAAVLGEIFPGRRIEAAIVWTDGPKLMPVPEKLVAQTLADLRRDG